MQTYKAPLRDISFVLKELLGTDQLRSLPGYENIQDSDIDAILTEAAKFCENTLLPLNRPGDEEGCHFEDGTVRTPKGFKEAYKEFMDIGWLSLSGDPKYGGQGLPVTISNIFNEISIATNLSFSVYPLLTTGAIHALEVSGSDELKQKFLPNLIAAKWGGTMCLTEPHCGTDLGLLRTKAVPQENGSYKLTGTKIFITSGEHDLTENIVHLVIARTPEAEPGIHGISLFLVPKFLVNDDGTLGARNGVTCASIEHKMGIKASSTCVMNFEDATGYLIGDLYKGMQNMFVMMNSARLGVGIQGLGIGEIAYQNALAYAKERLQGRALSGPQYPEKPADPILVHPDVRRMLLTMKAINEGNRMMITWVGLELDRSFKLQDPEEKQKADDLVQLMTPIVKAFVTDTGFDIANMGIQIYGGHGYIRENGMEQFVRDSRISQLYEGTNGIQAMDLIGRKLAVGNGRLVKAFFGIVQNYIEQHKNNEQMNEFIEPLEKALGRLQQATLTIATKAMLDHNEAGAAATDYLKLFALVTHAYLWNRAVEVSLPKASGEEQAFYQGKIDTARYFMQKILPQTGALFATLSAGAGSLMNFKDEGFGPF
jgi:alkylation response protein AidB-like acyl-CoA dehydrogenase